MFRGLSDTCLGLPVCSPHLSVETIAGLRLCSGHAWGQHGSSSLLPGSLSGPKGPDPASGGPGAAGGEGASPQGTLPAPTPLVQPKPGLCRETVSGVSE